MFSFEEMSAAQLGLLIAFLSAFVLSLVFAIVVSRVKPSFYRIYGIIALVVDTALLVAFIVLAAKNYSFVYVDDTTKNRLGLYLCSASLVCVIVLLCIFLGKKVECNHTKSVAYAAACLALSFALSYVRLFRLPQGGSVTLASLLPLLLYSYMFGIRKGVLLGFIYGIMQFMQDPWFIHPVQFLLDYPIAFAAIGLCGLFKEQGVLDKIKPLQFALGAIIAVIVRYASHVISGIFVWGNAENPEYTIVAWSFLYNSFAFVDMAFALLAGSILLSSKSVVNLLQKAKD